MVRADILVIGNISGSQPELRFLANQVASGAVVETDCAEEGLHLLEAGFEPELVICDVCVKGMGCLDIIKRIGQLNFSTVIAFDNQICEKVLEVLRDRALIFGLKSVVALPYPLTKDTLTSLIESATKDNAANSKSRPICFKATESGVAEALAANQLEAYFQPHVDTQTSELIGAEALIRWNHPEHGVLNPGQFLESVAGTEVMHQITLEMIQQAISAAVSWRCMGLNLRVSVNVDVSDIEKSNFAEMVSGMLNKAELAPSMLMLELTERELRHDIIAVFEGMTRIRKLDIGLSIDDFGTGHSSLEQLIMGPFTQIKIDRKFVAHMLACRKHLAAVKNTVSLARELDLELVVEGVENTAQVRSLKQMGCSIMQGYYWSKPLSNAQFTRWSTMFRDSNLKVAGVA
ncbi:transcriptional regulator [Neiella marina]|uniref:Transcriptional regulator n=1 Tax=Neiella marina TaxID=508461 RepID=A0A8J2U506_9GAMM|nr:EAL domain-containing protein [Neiella marina]GGA76934.1 transcriptional regulator [Neiella marina]